MAKFDLLSYALAEYQDVIARFVKSGGAIAYDAKYYNDNDCKSFQEIILAFGVNPRWFSPEMVCRTMPVEWADEGCLVNLFFLL